MFLEKGVGFFGALFLRLMNLTLRWEEPQFPGDLPPDWLERNSIILLFWHNRQLFMPWIYTRYRRGSVRKMYTLISAHRDGRFIADAVRRLGIDNVAGSSSRGSRGASRALLSCLKSGHHIAVTPDGPRGPRYELKAGVLKIARNSGASLYPAAYSAEYSWKFSSWDRMILPKPFSRAVLVMGEPIPISREEVVGDQLEETRKRVEKALMEATERADRFWEEQRRLENV